MYPFKELISTYDTSVRVFSKDIDEEELVWHRDREDRLLNVIKGGENWLIQLENELPKPIDSTYIKKGVYHRLIKGSDDLTIEVKKYVDI
jgi:hypothetical protein